MGEDEPVVTKLKQLDLPLRVYNDHMTKIEKVLYINILILEKKASQKKKSSCTRVYGTVPNATSRLTFCIFIYGTSSAILLCYIN